MVVNVGLNAEVSILLADALTEGLVMSEIRIIKKYPNRRLYDTAISSYITLEDARRLVLDGMDIQVVDARTKADITHSTLLQILVHEEEKHDPIFSNSDLQKIIRCYGNTRQNVAAEMISSGFSRVMEAPADPIASEEEKVNTWSAFSTMSSSRQEKTVYSEDGVHLTEN
jgi:polyhydroxyalkanoate synthesis repressor PhaR